MKVSIYVLLMLLSNLLIAQETKSNLYKNDIIFDIGTKWTYELQDHLKNTTEFVVYEIIDTTIFQGEKVWIISTPDGEKMLKQTNSKVWIYQDELADFQLTYDFELTTETQFEWGAICPDSIDGSKTHESTMTVDSITNYTLPNGQDSKIQHISYTLTTPIGEYDNFGRETIKNIGFRNEGLGLNTGYLICDNMIFSITKLRCFENDSISLNFVNYNCDSTWMRTNTIDDNKNRIAVYPNPSPGFIYINGIDFETDYFIYDSSGRLVQRGKTQNKTISVGSSGLYFLKFKAKDKWIFEKIIKME